MTSYRHAYAQVRPVVQQCALSLPQDTGGTMECPACHGVLHYQRMGFDGRVARTAAHCETPFCVQWTE